MDIGTALKTLRETNKITQSEFAKDLGISKTHVSYLENNRLNPSIKLLKEISAYYDTSLPVLLFMSLSEEDVPQERRYFFQRIKGVLDEAVRYLFLK